MLVKLFGDCAIHAILPSFSDNYRACSCSLARTPEPGNNVQALWRLQRSTTSIHASIIGPGLHPRRRHHRWPRSTSLSSPASICTAIITGLDLLLLASMLTPESLSSTDPEENRSIS
uniref:Uncharacterized protein n=1 Tax=Arundo donax TaxID=35708 RepID=A0A0A8ZWH7_ARUDO